jgi:hypothetical protein
VPVAAFTDPDKTAVATDFSASVNWGDGTAPDTAAPTVQITGSAGSFSVLGSHTYRAGGSYRTTVVVTDQGSAAGTDQGGDSATALATATVTAGVSPGTPNQRFVTLLYQDLLQRQPDAGGLNYFSTILDQGLVNRFQVTLAIETSLEHRQDQVTAAFQTLLGRSPDPITENLFVLYLARGATVAQMTVVLASTPEYLQKHGGTDSSFVTALFEDGLHRDPEPGAQTVFQRSLAFGMSRAQIAAVVFFSPEYQEDTIQAVFSQYLNRPAEPRAVALFLADLERHGLHDEELVMIVGGSQEFFNITQG